MFTSARSYLSRFSSLILFVLAVFIVGLLLVMTISSASNKNTVQDEVADGATTSETSLTYDQPEVAKEESATQSVSVEPSDSTSTSYSTGNPQTLAVTEVNLDSQDSVSINTTTADNAGRVDAPGVSINTAVLPDTGPSNIATGIAMLILTILGITYWTRSRQDLSRQLLIANR